MGGQIVKNKKHVSSLIAEILGNGHGSIGSYKNKPGCVGGGRGDCHNIVGHTPVLKFLEHPFGFDSFLADGRIHTNCTESGLIIYCLNQKIGFSGLPVPDYELPLATPERDDQVDDGNSGLKRSVCFLSFQNSGNRSIYAPNLLAISDGFCAIAVQKLQNAPQWIYRFAQKLHSRHDLKKRSRSGNPGAQFEGLFSKRSYFRVVLPERDYLSLRPFLKNDYFVDSGPRKPADVCHRVDHLIDIADFASSF